MKIKYLDNSQFIILNRKEFDVLVTEILNKYKKEGNYVRVFLPPKF